MIRIAIADDHQSIIEGIKLYFQYLENITIIGTANNGRDLLDLVRLKQPHVVIIDIRMPMLNGVETTRKLTKEFPHIKVIAFSMFDNNAIFHMKDAGAKGYILKNSSMKQLLKATYAVMEGYLYYDPDIDISIIKEPVKTDSKVSVLTKSEKHILRLVGEGNTSAQIAKIRHTAESTVEKHRKNIIYKLKIKEKGYTTLLDYIRDHKYSDF